MLQGIDYTGRLIGNIDFIEASWDRKWSEPGQFVIYMTLAEYNRLDSKGIKYVGNVGRPERGIIQKIEYQKETEGAFVTASGFFADKLLDFCAYRKTQVLKASNAESVKAAFLLYINNANAGVTVEGKTYKPIGAVNVKDESEYPASIEISIEQGKQMGTALYEALSDSGYGMLTGVEGYPADDNSEALNLSLIFRKGRQLTDDETGIFFGKAYNNVDDMSYKLDESAERCLYEIIQEVDADYYSSFSTSYFPIKYTEVVDGMTRYYIGCTYFYEGNQPSKIGQCYPKKILTTSLSSDECDLKVTTASNQQMIRNLMRKKAQIDMLDNYKVESIEVNVIQVKYEYMKDYDLGDTCVVLIDDLKQKYHARIEKINETHKNSMIEIQLVLGTPSKQKWRTR